VRDTTSIDYLHQQRVNLGRDVGAAGDLAAQCGQEGPLQLLANREQARGPLQVLHDSGEAAVVQLITAIQGQLQVLTVGIGLREGRGLDPRGSRRGVPAQGVQHRGGQRATRRRQHRRPHLVRCGRAQHRGSFRTRRR
jgi:hypothetical protein